jgi:hypothetical protein
VCHGLECGIPQGLSQGEGALASLEGALRVACAPQTIGHTGRHPAQSVLITQGLVEHVSLAHLGWIADTATAGIIGNLILGLQKVLTNVRAARPMLPEHRHLAKRIAEEAEAVEAAPDRLLAIVVQREAADHGDIGVNGMPERSTLVRLQYLVVLLRPGRRLHVRAIFMAGGLRAGVQRR